MKEPSIFVIVPARNEAAILPEVLSELVKTPYRVVLVDDGSEDETPRIARRFPVFLVRHPLNLGQGAALETGRLFALRHGADVLVHFDADGQHSVADIPRFVEALMSGPVDVALGSRFLNPRHAAHVPRSVRTVLQLGRVFNGLITGVWLTDAHNGFRAMTRRAAERLSLDENGYAHATEILEKLRRAGLRYVEVPTDISYSTYARGKGQGVLNAINIAVDLILRHVFR